jgi:hypothetical protein
VEGSEVRDAVPLRVVEEDLDPAGVGADVVEADHVDLGS